MRPALCFCAWGRDHSDSAGKLAFQWQPKTVRRAQQDSTVFLFLPTPPTAAISFRTSMIGCKGSLCAPRLVCQVVQPCPNQRH